MNKQAVAVHLRERAEKLINKEDRTRDEFDNAELLNCLARVLEGKTVEKAFGAVGDWGYSSEIGKAMIAPDPDRIKREIPL